jgi:hypothetical protein
MSTESKPNIQTQAGPTEALNDTDLSLKPSKEREQLLDAERRDEMNEHDEARVDGKHYTSAEEVVAVKEADADGHSSLSSNVNDKKAEPAQDSQAVSLKPAESKNERPKSD